MNSKIMANSRTEGDKKMGEILKCQTLKAKLALQIVTTTKIYIAVITSCYWNNGS